MRFVRGTILASVFLLTGFAAGFPMGKNDGFVKGGEWALLQAGIVAREAGLFMPVYMDQESFKIVIKQPRNIYKRAWKLAELHAGKKPDPGAKEEEQLPETGVEEDTLLSGGMCMLDGSTPEAPPMNTEATL